MKILSFSMFGILICVLASGVNRQALSVRSTLEEPPTHRAGTEAELNRPFGVAISPSNVLYVSTLEDSRIHRLDLRTGLLTLMQTKAPILGVGRLLLRSDKLIAAIPIQCRVAQINIDDGSVETIAGNLRSSGGCGSGGDNGPATQASIEPDFLTQDAEGNLFIVDDVQNTIRRIDKHSGIITTVVGPAGLRSLTSVAVTNRGEIFFSQVGKSSKGLGIMHIDASSGLLKALEASSFVGSKAVWAESMGPRWVFSDPLGGLYVLDESRIFHIDLAERIVSVLAGSKKGFAGDGGAAKQSKMFWPASLVMDSEGNIYIADFFNNRVRKIDAKTHIITTVAGNGGPPNKPGTLEIGLEPRFMSH
jgi:DNA-binding beta-propeller fold protein YncE